MGDLPPLPRDLSAALQRALGSNVLPPGGNAGLIWHRYCRVWVTGRDGPAPQRSEQNRDFLKQFCAGYAAQATLQQGLLQQRVVRLNTALPHGRDFATVGRLVTGLGSEHPVENGFTWEHTLGVPWLPGSSVKGLCRAGASLVRADKLAMERLLGTEHPARNDDPFAPLQCGEVVFYGALPTAWPRLDVDILNPHHPKYYADQGQEPRRRRLQAELTEEPKPVYFLTVADGVRFRFWLGGQGGRTLPKADMELVWEWLTLGLENLGIGGKTASGYGHMGAV